MPKTGQAISRRRELRRLRRQWPTHFPGKKPRLYLDSNIPESFVAELKKAGVDCVHPKQLDLENQADDAHWGEARRLNRYLVTCDLDFSDDRRYPLHESPGVVILDTGSKQDWSRSLTLLLGFINYLKSFTTGMGGGALAKRSKIRLTASRITWRMLTFRSEISTEVYDWGPWW
jgi:predicted nuclease of predicted toxin-antitoxin system